jgi:hypothetical protein
LPTKVADYHNHPADHKTLKVDDVLQQMKTRCRNELTLVIQGYIHDDQEDLINKHVMMIRVTNNI